MSKVSGVIAGIVHGMAPCAKRLRWNADRFAGISVRRRDGMIGFGDRQVEGNTGWLYQRGETCWQCLEEVC
jgi:hypothetical protein